MPIDVWTETVIARPLAEVAAFAANPDNAPRWYAKIKSVEWKSPKPLRTGSKVGFTASFLGRRLDYVYEVVEWRLERRFVMRSVAGPFPMETIYIWEPTPKGTRMALRNRGGPSGFLGFLAPLISAAMRRANEKDLARLKKILEDPSPPR